MTEPAAEKNIDFTSRPQLGQAAAEPPPQLNTTLVVPREEIATGSVLLKSGTLIPATLPMRPRWLEDWDLICELDGFAMDRKLREAGWHFFFMAPAVEAIAIGLDPQRTFEKALRRIGRAVEAQRLNALEITAVKRMRWLGIEYVKIVAHPRHVRSGPFLRDPDLGDFKIVSTRATGRRPTEMPHRPAEAR